MKDVLANRFKREKIGDLKHVKGQIDLSLIAKQNSDRSKQFGAFMTWRMSVSETCCNIPPHVRCEQDLADCVRSGRVRKDLGDRCSYYVIKRELQVQGGPCKNQGYLIYQTAVVRTFCLSSRGKWA